VQCAQTIMRSVEDKHQLARTVLSHAISGPLSGEPQRSEHFSDKAVSGKPVPEKPPSEKPATVEQP
jgi:hypothetical protein